MSTTRSGENAIVFGINLESLLVGARLRRGDVLFEFTQTGKECHAYCAIYHRMGDCIMPREGVFCRVLEGGVIRPGDAIDVVG